MKSWDIKQIQSKGGLPSISKGNADDIFLVCASYEPRTLGVVESLSPQYRSSRGMIYVNKEFLEGPSGEKTQKNLKKLRKILDRHCENVSIITGSWLDPKEQLLSLKKALTDSSINDQSPTRITLDTTTFNREALLISVLLLRTALSNPIIRVYYVSPEKHGEWLSQGFRCVRNVMGFGGLQHPSRSTVVAVLSGFESERTLKVIEAHEPGKVLLGIGDPPTEEKFKERNENEQKLVLARQEVERFTFPADNIFPCYKKLENVLSPYLANYNIVLAPMSTKLSTLAALLFVERHPETQLTYCVPGEYNIDDYSSGMKSLYLDKIPHE